MQNDIDFKQALCQHCYHLSPVSLDECPVCEEVLHQRKPNSYIRTLALSLSALFFFIPANIYPIMKTVSFIDYQNSTIMDGIFYFFEHGEFFVGTVIFMASVFVPVLKLVILFYLLLSVRNHSTWRRVQKKNLYKMIHVIGKWSMLDIFVIGLMITLVQFGELAEVTTGFAALSFATMVVLTIFATESFDTRLLWDKKEDV